MKKVDSIISAHAILPIDSDEAKILKQHALIIHQGIIVDIIHQDKIHQHYQTNRHYQLNTHCLMPGMVNAHTHTPMSLLKGFADDLPLETWLNDYIFPTESEFVGDEFVKTGTTLAIAEMIKSGTTCFNDMYFYSDSTAKAVIKSGIRAQLGVVIMQFPSNWANNSDAYIDKGLEIYERYQQEDRLTFSLAPHAPYSNDDKTLIKVAELSQALDLPIHMHIHETKQEVEDSIKIYGMRPLARLEKLGILSQRLLAVHMTQLTKDEIKLCQKFNISIAHCPQSNMKLASGYCPIVDLQAQGVNIALGTDGSASNNDLDMFSEMLSANLLAKMMKDDATKIKAYESLQMATIKGAIALGLDKKIGSLEIGKSADIIAIDFSNIEHNIHHNIVSQLVYSMNKSAVDYVWVKGKTLLEKGKLTTIDCEKLSNKKHHWQNKIARFYAGL
ncbi:S-adenosylhomocysteine deaminase; Methylthioadenosine deaminase [uncultured Candidatus Thioglobus sp.]|nr:S-adenosylhomocysteine deaminase; Methylthioadenosine deaminase [uncultured Candidatus Thioglobus sp.]